MSQIRSVEIITEDFRISLIRNRIELYKDNLKYQYYTYPDVIIPHDWMLYAPTNKNPQRYRITHGFLDGVRLINIKPHREVNSIMYIKNGRFHLIVSDLAISSKLINVNREEI